MKKTRMTRTREALTSSSVRRAGKKIVRGVREDVNAVEMRAKNEAKRHLLKAKQGFTRSKARVEHYIEKNPKKAVALAAILAAAVAAAASYAIASRGKKR